jgi:hypothetical protein
MTVDLCNPWRLCQPLRQCYQERWGRGKHGPAWATTRSRMRAFLAFMRPASATTRLVLGLALLGLIGLQLWHTADVEDNRPSLPEDRVTVVVRLDVPRRWGVALHNIRLLSEFAEVDRVVLLWNIPFPVPLWINVFVTARPRVSLQRNLLLDENHTDSFMLVGDLGTRVVLLLSDDVVLTKSAVECVLDQRELGEQEVVSALWERVEHGARLRRTQWTEEELGKSGQWLWSLGLALVPSSLLGNYSRVASQLRNYQTPAEARCDVVLLNHLWQARRRLPLPEGSWMLFGEACSAVAREAAFASPCEAEFALQFGPVSQTRLLASGACGAVDDAAAQQPRKPAVLRTCAELEATSMWRPSKRVAVIDRIRHCLSAVYAEQVNDGTERICGSLSHFVEHSRHYSRVGVTI